MRGQGVPVSGQPLDVTVPIGREALAQGLPPCTQAEVYYGDRMVSAGQVTTELQPNANAAILRVRSSAVVDHAAVTIYLHMGCSSIVTHRIDLSSQRVQPAAAPVAVPVPAVESGTAGVLSAPVSAAPRPGPSVQEGGDRIRARAPAPTVASAPSPVPPAARPSAMERAPSALSKGGLPVPVTPSVEAVSPAGIAIEALSLRMTSQLSVGEPVSAEQRAGAAALWRAIAVTPDEILAERVAARAVEQKLHVANQGVIQRDAALATLGSQLDDARTARYANPVVYGLLALLLVVSLVGIVALLRNRAARAAERWRLLDEMDSEVFMSSRRRGKGAGARASEDSGSGAPSTLAWSARAGASTVRQDSVLDEAWETESNAVRDQAAEALADVQQEADFFTALGQPDTAIVLLRNFVAAHRQASPAVWMKMLTLHHRMGRRAPYEEVRVHLMQSFEVQVPPFDDYVEAPAASRAASSAT